MTPYIIVSARTYKGGISKRHKRYYWNQEENAWLPDPAKATQYPTYRAAAQKSSALAPLRPSGSLVFVDGLHEEGH